MSTVDKLTDEQVFNMREKITKLHYQNVELIGALKDAILALEHLENRTDCWHKTSQRLRKVLEVVSES